MEVAFTFLHFVTEHVDLCLACTGTLHNVQSVDFQLRSCCSFCSDAHRINISVVGFDSDFIIQCHDNVEIADLLV